ncbi:hypothetical protein GE061_005532 [Apolygus lucorum]|uniref:Uncharacterized protein n=1 Tax=Apolygus lucorum TaxID=248454 RepID=A0A8S9X0H3_APOLU|nr:hypothetical protein GE061_005532 [Apolygus lucorum]
MNSNVHGIKFEPVELAKELQVKEISDWDIPTLVCLAHNMSNFDTRFRTSQKHGNNEVSYLGIFGIADKQASDVCNMTKNDLIDDDIDDDIRCLYRLIDEKFFKYSRGLMIIMYSHKVLWVENCIEWFESLPADRELSHMPSCTSVELQNFDDPSVSKRGKTSCPAENTDEVVATLIAVMSAIQLICSVVLWRKMKSRRIIPRLIPSVSQDLSAVDRPFNL